MADKPVVDVNTDNLADFTKLLYGDADEKAAEADTPNIADDDPGADANATDTSEGDEDEGTPVVDDADLDGGSDDPDEANADSPDEDIFKPKSKKKQTAQERIDEVTAEKHNERRRAEAAELRLAELERALAELRAAPKQVPTNEAPVANPTGVSDPNAPDPESVDAQGNLIYPLGEFDVNFIAAVHRYEAQKARAEVEAAATKTAEQKAVEAEEAKLFETWQGKLTKAEETFPDLRATVAALDTEFVDLDPTLGTYLAKTIMEMDHGAEVLYYLANNVDEAKQIVAAGQTGATLALGRLEGKISVALGKKAKTPAPRQTKAPVPPATHTRGSGAAKTSIKGDTDNFADFKKLFYSE
jgi:hypothetical protein